MLWMQRTDHPLALTVPKPPRTTLAVWQFDGSPENGKLCPLRLYISFRHNLGDAATARCPERIECRVNGLIREQCGKIRFCREEPREDPDQCSVSLMFVSVLKIRSTRIRVDSANIADFWPDS